MTTNNDLDQAREWAKWIIQADSQVEVDPDLRGAAEVIQSLPDEWIDADNLADEGRLMPDLPEPTMDMADPHLAVWESGVTAHPEVVYVPHFLPLDDVELVEQIGMDLMAAAAHVRKQAEKGAGRADA